MTRPSSKRPRPTRSNPTRPNLTRPNLTRPRPTRRRALKIMAATAAGLSAVVGAGATPQRIPGMVSWQGTVLGANATLMLHDGGPEPADHALEAVLNEIGRLDKIFSLYRPESEISKLNRDGRLVRASLDMRLLMRRALDWGEQSGGTFDITVQPLWQAYARYFEGDGQQTTLEESVSGALEAVNYRRIRIEHGGIVLGPHQAVTLNGIAQGYITDAVTELLQARGWHNVLVDLGESRFIGGHPSGRAWNVGLGRASGPNIPASGGAVATSAATATRFEPSGRFNHLMDPRSGACAAPGRRITVSAATATDADALATVLAVSSPAAGEQLVRALGIGAAIYGV